MRRPKAIAVIVPSALFPTGCCSSRVIPNFFNSSACASNFPFVSSLTWRCSHGTAGDPPQRAQPIPCESIRELPQRTQRIIYTCLLAKLEETAHYSTPHGTARFATGGVKCSDAIGMLLEPSRPPSHLRWMPNARVCTFLSRMKSSTENPGFSMAVNHVAMKVHCDTCENSLGAPVTELTDSPPASWSGWGLSVQAAIAYW